METIGDNKARKKLRHKKKLNKFQTFVKNIKINENKVTKKDLQTLYDTLTSKGYPVAQIGEEKHSTKNAPVKNSNHQDKSW